VGVDAVVGGLQVASPEIRIAEGHYPLHGLQLNDVYVGIDLRPDTSQTPPDTSQTEPAPLRLCFDLPDGELRNIHFRLTPLGLDIQTGSLSTHALIDVGANKYDARRLNVGRFALALNNLYIPVDTLYGSAVADIHPNLITTPGLYARSEAIGATARLTAAAMNLNSMRVEANGEADFRGSQASLQAWYDINNEAYEATVHVDRVNLTPFLKDSTRIVVAGDIEAAGQGINPKKPMASRIRLHLDKAIYDTYDLSGTSVDFSTDSATSLALQAPGLNLRAGTPMGLFPFIDKVLPLVETVSDSAVLNALVSFRDLTVIDTIRHRIPPVEADINDEFD
jgi:hypothetical protein